MNPRIAAGAVLLLTLSLPGLAAQESIDPFSLGEPLVLSFRQERYRIMDGVLAFLDPAGKVYLPLDEICRGLGLAIEVDVPSRRAEGFYLAEENGFSLDLARGSVESAGERFGIPGGSIFAAEMELYVELETLERWLKDVRLIYHRSSLAVEVESDPLLPVVARLGRQGKRSRVSKIETARSRLELPAVTAPYRLFSRPILDADSTYRWSRGQESSFSLDLRGAHDLFGLGARWFVGLDGQMKPREARLTLHRKDPAGGLLGRLAATELELGDVAGFGAPLIGGGSRGAGFRISNRPREVSGGTTLDLMGELPAGWEAELYRGDALVAFEAEADRGQYLFDDIPLFPGVNELKVVRHGPQGQRDELRRTVRLGGDQPAPGKWYLEASAFLEGSSMVPLQTGAGVSSERRSDDPDLGKLAAEARFSLGLRPGLSLAGALSTRSLAGRRIAFAGLSTELFVGGFNLTLDSAVDQGGRWAAGGRAVASLGGFGIFLQHQEFAPRFRSPSNARGRPLRRRSELRLRRSLGLPLLPRPLRTVLRAKYENGIDGAAKTDLRLGASTSAGPWRIQNELSGSWTRGGDGEARWSPLGGDLGLERRRRGASLRAGLAYTLAPQTELRSVKLSARKRILDGALQLNPTLQHELGGGTSLGVSLGWQLPQAEISAQVNADSGGSLSASLGLRFSLSWRGTRPLPHLEGRAQTTRSLAHAEVFLDEDHDGERSPGERPLAGVRLSPGRRHEITDRRGSLALFDLSELVPTDVLLDEGSLGDPFLRPGTPGYRVTARPGAPVRLLFPVVRVSDIEGMVLVTKEVSDPEGKPLGPQTRGLGNVEIVAFDAQGEEVARRRSEFDGFFYIPSLPAGSYRLRMDEAQAARFGLYDGGGIEVFLDADSALLSGLELQLESSETAAGAPG